MFRPVRRSDRQMAEKDCLAVLGAGTSGVLALCGDEDYPYALPISYAYAGGKLYFHSAKEGHKIDAARHCDKVSFCVVAEDRVCPEQYTTHYRSVIAFGRIRLVEDEAELRQAMLHLAEKYSPTLGRDSHLQTIAGARAQLAVLALEIEHLTGKQHPSLLHADAQSE